MIVNIIDKGADPTGTANSTAAVQAAHDALPSSGGTIYAPAGDYWIENVNVTKRCVKILGDGPPGLPGEAGLQSNGPTRFFVRTPGVNGISLNGPLVGASLENIHLDGGGVGSVGLWETSIVHGDHRNVLFTGWTNTSHVIRTVPSSSFIAAHERNRYVNFTYFLPSVSCTGLSIDGNDTDLTNADFNTWESTIVFMLRPQHEMRQYGISLGNCDSNVFRDTSFYYWDAGANLSTVMAILLDNTRAGKIPLQNIVDNVDFAGGFAGPHFAPVYNYGPNLPPANWFSLIVKGVSPINGFTPSPGLSNVAWIEH